MTVTSQIATIASSISGLSISGVTIASLTTIPESATMLVPLLLPDPANYISGYTYKRDSYGSGSSGAKTSTYNINYVFLHSPVGSGLGAYAPFASLYGMVETILEAIFSNDTLVGLVDLTLQDVSGVGVVTDPSGVEFWGLRITLRVEEFNQ